MQEKVRYILKWEAAPRPPVHPDWMVGTMKFKTPDDAFFFFASQARDSKFLSLTKETIITEDVSDYYLNP